MAKVSVSSVQPFQDGLALAICAIKVPCGPRSGATINGRWVAMGLPPSALMSTPKLKSRMRA